VTIKNHFQKIEGGDYAMLELIILMTYHMHSVINDVLVEDNFFASQYD
jgi:hypothetical protein